MHKNVTQLVVADPTYVGCLTSERGHTSAGVRNGAPRNLTGWSHFSIESRCLFGVDQGHGPFGEALRFNEAVFSWGQNINDGVTDPNDVVLHIARGLASSPYFRKGGNGLLLSNSIIAAG